MIKLFDGLTVKRRYFMVEDGDMIEVLNMIQSALSVSKPVKVISIGGYRSVDERNLWSVCAVLTSRQWRTLLQECKDKHYKLVIKDIPNRMYFERVKRV